MTARNAFEVKRGGTLTREKFLLDEIRMVATLRESGISDEDIIRRAADDNIFQYPTTREAAGMARACLHRLDALDRPELVRLLVAGSGSFDQAAQVNLYAIARAYRLMREFLEEEVAMRYRTLDFELTAADVNSFFTRIRARDEEVASWSEATFTKLRGVLRGSLVKAGLMRSVSSSELIPFAIDPVLEEAMAANGDFDILPAFNCMHVDACDSRSDR
ncbi:MAG: DUF1819 family protein [Slackia sp.]|nr:DUF1819 family protein [Slackia sp.]